MSMNSKLDRRGRYMSSEERQQRNELEKREIELEVERKKSRK